MVACILYSCQPEKEELAIADYVQTVGDTKTNMNFELISLEYKGDVSGMDSLKLLYEKNAGEKDRGMGATAYVKKLDGFVDYLDSCLAYYQREYESIDALNDYAYSELKMI